MSINKKKYIHKNEFIQSSFLGVSDVRIELPIDTSEEVIADKQYYCNLYVHDDNRIFLDDLPIKGSWFISHLETGEIVDG